jgi:hypothetical protein
MEVVYRIYDNILASGVEAIFAFSLVLLQKNENVLLDLRFDEILQFLNNKLFNVYQVCPSSELWCALLSKIQFRHPIPHLL